MANTDWERFGEEIRRTVQNAVDSQDFAQLNQTITNTINNAVDSAAKGMKNVGEAMGRAGKAGGRYRYNGRNSTGQAQWHKEQQETGQQETGQRYRRTAYEVKPQPPALYAKTTPAKVGGTVMSAIGFSLGICSFIGLMIFLIAGFVMHNYGLGFRIFIALFGILTAVFGGVAGAGTSMLGKVRRFRAYLQALQGREYCDIRELAGRIHKSSQFVVRDVERMIANGWFSQGHLDRQKSCLITSHQAFGQYRQMMEQEETKRREEENLTKQQAESYSKARQEDAGLPREVQDVIRAGDEFIRRIHEANDAIPGEEISAKISRMETLVDRIFDRVEQNPETVSDIRRLMDYYLPTTIKLLEAYEQLDAQPVQGGNIQSSKKEIEATLDTLNQAFEKLLDDLFQDTAWDVSADISVLHTMLAQEGLTGNDFEPKGGQ